jgi:hypothetical protein
VSLTLSLLVACSGGSDNSFDAGIDAANVDVSPAATFTEIYEMMFPNSTNARCNFCHSLPANEISNGKLNMGATRQSALLALLGKSSISVKCQGRPLVTPFKVSESLFLAKLLNTTPCGDRMPLGGKVFSEEQLGMIRSWIAAGAKDD